MVQFENIYFSNFSEMFIAELRVCTIQCKQSTLLVEA